MGVSCVHIPWTPRFLGDSLTLQTLYLEMGPQTRTYLSWYCVEVMKQQGSCNSRDSLAFKPKTCFCEWWFVCTWLMILLLSDYIYGLWDSCLVYEDFGWLIGIFSLLQWPCYGIVVQCLFHVVIGLLLTEFRYIPMCCCHKWDPRFTEQNMIIYGPSPFL